MVRRSGSHSFLNSYVYMDVRTCYYCSVGYADYYMQCWHYSNYVNQPLGMHVSELCITCYKQFQTSV